MMLCRSLLAKSSHVRPYFRSTSSFIHQADTPPPPPSPQPAAAPPSTYLEGFPTPDPKYAETILAIPLDASDKYIAAMERHAGRVPFFLFQQEGGEHSGDKRLISRVSSDYIAARERNAGRVLGFLFQQEGGEHGGNKRLISVRANQIRKLVRQLGPSFFLSRLFDLEVRPELDSETDPIEKVRVLPRLLHLHPTTDEPINVSFIRAPSRALLKVDIPLVFRGEDVSPGLRKGSYLNVMMKTAKFRCPADLIPPYIEVDLSELDVGQRVRIADLKVHPELLPLLPKEHPVCKIKGSRATDQKKSK